GALRGRGAGRGFAGHRSERLGRQRASTLVLPHARLRRACRLHVEGARVTTVLLILGGYVLGSMPWGYWLTRLVKREDIRDHGSGNIGGTNVWRVYGWRLGLPVVLFDTAKGFVPAFVATITVSHLTGVLAGAAAMLGHWRPLFLRWQRGGKIVATCGGAFLGVAPVVGGIGAAVWPLSSSARSSPTVPYRSATTS